MMSLSSYQLPDLLSLTQAFELRTNRFCRTVTNASEAWLLNLTSPTDSMTPVLTQTERDLLHPMKVGLLASVCFPSCDLPQLRLIVDFITFLFFAARRLQGARPGRSGWTDGDGDDVLDYHDLFLLLRPKLDRLTARASHHWKVHFNRAVKSYRDAQQQLIANTQRNFIPELETYLRLRRDLSGFDMLFDLAQLAQNLRLPPLDREKWHDIRDKFSKLKRHAIDVIAFSLDVVAFDTDQAHGNRHNLVAVLMAHKRLSIQGALNLAGSMIKQAVDSFLSTEQALFDALTSLSADPATDKVTSYWKWFSSVRMATPPPLPRPSSPSPTPAAAEVMFVEDLPEYIQTLRDCIAGTINWAYETELYFGTKGEEIRTFGWVFLAPKVEIDSSVEGN